MIQKKKVPSIIWSCSSSVSTSEHVIVIILHDQWIPSITKKVKLSGYRKGEKTCSTNLYLWQHSCLQGWSSESRRREGDINMQRWESIQGKSPSEGHLVQSALFEGDHACYDWTGLPCMLAPPNWERYSLLRGRATTTRDLRVPPTFIDSPVLPVPYN